jgi:hypothetical protein
MLMGAWAPPELLVAVVVRCNVGTLGIEDISRMPYEFSWVGNGGRTAGAELLLCRFANMDADDILGGRRAAADSLRPWLDPPDERSAGAVVVNELSASEDLNLCVNVRADNDGFALVCDGVVGT